MFSTEQLLQIMISESSPQNRLSKFQRTNIARSGAWPFFFKFAQCAMVLDSKCVALHDFKICTIDSSCTSFEQPQFSPLNVKYAVWREFYAKRLIFITCSPAFYILFLEDLPYGPAQTHSSWLSHAPITRLVTECSQSLQQRSGTVYHFQSKISNQPIRH